jgi:hypothetical protein
MDSDFGVRHFKRGIQHLPKSDFCASDFKFLLTYFFLTLSIQFWLPFCQKETVVSSQRSDYDPVLRIRLNPPVSFPTEGEGEGRGVNCDVSQLSTI